jgi:hypothetical protein
LVETAWVVVESAAVVSVVVESAAEVPVSVVNVVAEVA